MSTFLLQVHILVEWIKDNPDRWNSLVESVIDRAGLSKGRWPQRQRPVFDLRGVDLSGLDLTGVRFQYCDLSGAKLRESRFFRTEFKNCDLTGTDLRGTDLLGASFINVKLNRADLRASTGLLKRLFSVDMTDALMDDEGAGFYLKGYLSRLKEVEDAPARVQTRVRFELGKCTLKPFEEAEPLQGRYRSEGVRVKSGIAHGATRAILKKGKVVAIYDLNKLNL